MTGGWPHLRYVHGAARGQALDLTPTGREPWLGRLHRERPAPAREIERVLAVKPMLDARGFPVGSWGTAAHLRESPKR